MGCRIGRATGAGQEWVVPSQRKDKAASDFESHSGYWTFYREVATRQLRAWLPDRPGRVLDLSGPGGDAAHLATAAGHEVVRVSGRPAGSGGSPGSPDADGTANASRASVVVGDAAHPRFFADSTADAIVAERLSASLAAETTVGDFARVLRPGGRLLLRVDSLLLGMARLAEQQYWAELSDAPRAEVLLVPGPDGALSRSFWPEQLHEVLTEAGLEAEWIRPRTMLSPTVVQRALSDNPGALAELVETELALPSDRGDDAVGFHLLASARRPEH